MNHDYGSPDFDPEYYFVDCYYDTHPDCLSSLYLSKEEQDYLFTTNNTFEFNCLYDSWLTVAEEFYNRGLVAKDVVSDILKNSCSPFYDNATCWPFTFSGHTESTNCPNFTHILLPDVALNRTCQDGIWSKSNFLDCISEGGKEAIKIACQNGATTVEGIACEYINNATIETVTTDEPFYIPPQSEQWDQLALIMRDIYFYGGCASLLFLAIALTIFCAFKSLQCPRVHIHKNLVLSLMLQCIVNIVIFEPYVKLGIEVESPIDANRKTYIEHKWLCKTMFTLNNYFSMTNVFWAFVEGLFLISRISIAVFSSKTPYWLFYLIGWGAPAGFTLAWALCMHYDHAEQDCWRKPIDTDYINIIQGPVLVAVTANLIFLIWILRILVTKLYAVTTDEHVQIRETNRKNKLLRPSSIWKAMKATVVLLPLLSITTVLYMWAPELEVNPTAHIAYRIITACLQVAQGILVSVLFCFFNGEVRSALVKYWKQWKSGKFRYRSSRASSVCVTQSETFMLWKYSPLSLRRYGSTTSRAETPQHLVITAGSQLRRMSHTSHLSSAATADITGTVV